MASSSLLWKRGAGKLRVSVVVLSFARIMHMLMLMHLHPFTLFDSFDFAMNMRCYDCKALGHT